jgi:hypothetical protein
MRVSHQVTCRANVLRKAVVAKSEKVIVMIEVCET